MASNNDDQIVQYAVMPDGESPTLSPNTPTQLNLNITISFTRRPRPAEEESVDPRRSSATRTVAFFVPLYHRPEDYNHRNIIPTENEIMGMLDAVHAQPRQAALQALAGQIGACCASMALAAPCLGRVLSIVVDVDLLVDQLPWEAVNHHDGLPRYAGARSGRTPSVDGTVARLLETVD